MIQDLRTKLFYGPLAIQYNILLKICGHKDSIRNFLLRFDLLHDNSRILEAGCGSGAVTIPLAELYPNSEIVAFDYSLDMLRQAKNEARKRSLKNILFLEGNVESINPLRDEDSLEVLLEKGSFDFIITSGVLEHVNLDKALNELVKYLKNNGYFINIGVKEYPFGKIQSFLMGFKVYKPNELKEAFKKANLKNIHEIPLRLRELYAKLSKIVLIGKK